MAQVLRAMGPYNGILPESTGQVIGFIRDPKKNPYIKYTQLIPAPEINFRWFNMDPDEPVRLVNLNDYAWGYDDYAPRGEGFTVKGDWTPGTIGRWAFPFTIGETTQRTWGKSGINAKNIYSQIRASHASLHRASRVVATLVSGGPLGWGANTAALQTVMANAAAFFDLSSGNETTSDGFGTPNPNFQIIKKTFQRIHRFINLSTNAAVRGEELLAVLTPTVAEAMATSGEIVNFLKQSNYAKELTENNYDDWGIPDKYAGFKLVVEDTPHVLINQHDDGTVASVLIPSQKDYIYDDNSVTFCSRVGGLDGGYGHMNFSTFQVFHYGGESRIEAFSQPEDDLTMARVVLEDSVQAPATISGFRLTNVISPNFAGTYP